MRISDWSSDVCSSDLLGGPFPDEEAVGALRQCEEIGDATLAGFSRIYLARKWRNEGRTQEAVDLLEDQLSEVESTGYQRLIGEVRTEESRVGKECVRQCSVRWPPAH